MKIDANKINSKLKLKTDDAYIHAEKLFWDGWLLTVVWVVICCGQKLLRCLAFTSKFYVTLNLSWVNTYMRAQVSYDIASAL